MGAAEARRGRAEALARRAMFATVLETEARLHEIIARRRAYTAQQTRIHYHALLYSLTRRDHDDDALGTGSSRQTAHVRWQRRSNKKLSYRRVTARCVVSIEILPIATQQCRNYLYDKT